MTPNRNQRKFAERRASGMSIEDAAAGVCAESTAYEWLKKPEIEQLIEELKLAEHPEAQPENSDDVDPERSLRRALIIAEKRGSPRDIAVVAEKLSQHRERVKPAKFQVTEATEFEIAKLVGIHVKDWGARACIIEHVWRWFEEAWPDHLTWTDEDLRRMQETGEMPRVGLPKALVDPHPDVATATQETGA